MRALSIFKLKFFNRIEKKEIIEIYNMCVPTQSEVRDLSESRSMKSHVAFEFISCGPATWKNNLKRDIVCKI